MPAHVSAIFSVVALYGSGFRTPRDRADIAVTGIVLRTHGPGRGNGLLFVREVGRFGDQLSRLSVRQEGAVTRRVAIVAGDKVAL